MPYTAELASEMLQYTVMSQTTGLAREDVITCSNTCRIDQRDIRQSGNASYCTIGQRDFILENLVMPHTAQLVTEISY